MLTGYQASTGAYMNEYGELFCTEHAEELLESTWDGGARFRALSNYELESWQSERFAGEDPEDVFGEPGHTAECEPELYCDQCSAELVEAFHYGHDEEADDDDVPLPGEQYRLTGPGSIAEGNSWADSRVAIRPPSAPSRPEELR